MNILLINPTYPNTYWSLKHALKFISKKATYPPLGLLTVASILPKKWGKKLVDLNTIGLKDKDIVWADYVFIGAMSVQKQSAEELIRRVQHMGVKVVAGGPLFTEEPERFTHVEHLILNEAEITLPEFISDLKSNSVKKMYKTENHAIMYDSPLPDYSLIKPSKYASMSIQYSRGCPFNCEFCDITALLGRKVRIKSTDQILRELDALLYLDWQGPVFFVDDNFIGNTPKLKKSLLPALIQWMHDHKSPFSFVTEASVNLADDPELMSMMVRAGFTKVFLGIESPNEQSLAECNKTQNEKRDLAQSVQRIHAYGMEVSAGFIVGFDHDPPEIFQQQIDFIQKSGIISAMVGLLNAPKKTQLYTRLANEGRIINEWGGDNTDYSMNFIPKMDPNLLLNGYKKIVHTIYSGKEYSARVKKFLIHISSSQIPRSNLSFIRILAFIKSIFVLGILEKSRLYYWKLILWSVFKRPEVFPMAVAYSIYGYHYRKVFHV